VPSLESTRSPIHSASPRRRTSLPAIIRAPSLGRVETILICLIALARITDNHPNAPFNPSVLESSAHLFRNRANGRELCSSLYTAPPQVSEASRRGKAASTRETRYIALHSHYCAGFSAARVSEMLRSRARRADDRTTREGAGEGQGGGRGGGGGDNAISNPIRNCRQPFGRHSRNEHKILLRGYFGERRYLASCTPRIERSKYPSPPPLSPRTVPTLRFDCAPLDPRLGLRRISHITFRGLHLLHLLLLDLTRPNAPMLSHEIAFKLFGFLARRGFIVRNLRRIA